jgi:biopolymer transport protein ExbD
MATQPPSKPPSSKQPPAKGAGKPPPPAPEEGKKRRRKAVPPVEETEMDMTPMIDCVFQLLIFFMTCTRFKSLEGKLLAYLPKDKGLKNVKVEEQKLPIRVTMYWNVATQQAKVYVGQTFTGIADQGGLDRAKEKVRQIKATGTDKAEIDAVPELPFRFVVECLNMLIQTNVKEISFAAGAP